MAFFFVLSQIYQINPVLFDFSQSFYNKNNGPETRIFMPYRPVYQSKTLKKFDTSSSQVGVRIVRQNLEFFNLIDSSVLYEINFSKEFGDSIHILYTGVEFILLSAGTDMWKISLETFKPEWALNIGAQPVSVIRQNKDFLFLAHTKKSYFLVKLSENAEILALSDYLINSFKSLMLISNQAYLCSQEGKSYQILESQEKELSVRPADFQSDCPF